MTENPGNKEAITIEELVISHSYEMLALITVLEKKGVLTRQEIVEEIQGLQAQ